MTRSEWRTDRFGLWLAKHSEAVLIVGGLVALALLAAAGLCVRL